MSPRELTRLEVIQRVKRKTLKQRQAAELLSITVRQVKRLCQAYQGSGAAGLISKRRGQPSNNRLPEKTINKARQLLRARYPDFGPTLATEKLALEGVSLSVETVRQLLIGEGFWKAKAVRRRVIHQLRERRARLGELVQIDGSPPIGLSTALPNARCKLRQLSITLRGCVHTSTAHTSSNKE